MNEKQTRESTIVKRIGKKKKGFKIKPYPKAERMK
ncbi:hypothetical protein LCGC14_1842450 [marine sediment metagenome]|uniref:Uncharacterized protein n=1 Tax=marine sediment metagenome TaxID=412755 RepID=A0A0F9JC41_9ZZZZ